ncbi:MAG: hypothetical protein IJW37_01700 [Lachnospiraceae bacterium]|nr:hypothetical protein [Lachnospiraceae bacterium]
MKKKVFLLGSLCAAFLLAGCAEKIDLNEYLDVDYDGVSGYATASYEIDYADLITDYEEIFGFDEDDLEDEDGLDFLEDVQDAISGELNESEGLKNGDELSFTWEVDAKKLEEKYKVKFQYTDVSEVVEDLDELEAVDAFAGVELNFDGPSGYAEAELDTWSQEYYMFDYELSASENLKNGDKVTLSVKDGYMEYCVEEGIIPQETVKTYTVEGLAELEEFDAFEGLKVEYKGVAPFGSVSINDAAVKYDELNFYCDASKVSNGDEITVTVDEYSVEKCIQYYNEIPKEMTKTYTVSGLDTLVMDYADIPEESWTQIYEDWRTYLLENMSSYWETPEALKDVKYIGRSFGKPTEDVLKIWNSPIFYITLFYEITAQQPDQEPFTYYYALEFKNLKQTPDGTYAYDEYSEPGRYSGWWGVSGNTFAKDNLYYIGFDTFNAAYEEYIINDESGYNTYGEFAEGYEYVTE